MPYNPNVPNASQSPGQFPPQNSENFNRLKTIINADHVFNDSTQDTDGAHRQCTMVEHALGQPSDIPVGTNAMLYTWLDANSQAQLRFYNQTNDFQLTPPTEIYPIRVVGSQSVAAGSTVTAYANPGFRYAGTGWATVEGNSIFRFYNILRMGSNDVNEIDASSGGGPISRPAFSFSSNNLRITNNDSSTRTLQWSLIINRIS